MKKYIFILLCNLSLIFTVNAQWNGTNPLSTNANVGIGTTTVTSPLIINKATWHLVPTLEIIHSPENPGCNGCLNIAQKISVLDNTGTNKQNIGLWVNTLNASYNYAAIFENGNVGIGTTVPGAKLQIVNQAQNSNGNTLILGPGGGAQLRLGYNTTYSWIQAHGSKPLHINELGNNTILNLSGGNVGIGTTEIGTHKLAVEGTIGAREIKVEADTWSDFVFNDNYKLKALEEVESFIEENNHLPDVPSEKEVLEKGIALGEMKAKLLQKIEELTLYVIDINKRVKSLEEENKALKEENSILKAQ